MPCYIVLNLGGFSRQNEEFGKESESLSVIAWFLPEVGGRGEVNLLNSVSQHEII